MLNYPFLISHDGEIHMSTQSPLHKNHAELKAKFTEFAGFNMPLQFSSIKDEHLQVRKSVGLFDVSHMSNVWITGKDAEKLLTLTTIEDASKIVKNKSQYTAILRDDGTIIDDTIFMHLDDRFMIIPNAGMDEIVTDWLNKKAKEHNLSVKVENVSKDYVILAVQGPKSKELLQKMTDVDLSTIGFFGCKEIVLADQKCIISYTGYTGELGFELQITPVEKAVPLFNKILGIGKEFKIKPIGLGARDTLRLEKCFLLAGNEFEGGRTPLEAVMSWAINWDHEFIGKESLLKQKEEGSYQRLTCLECNEKGIPRHGNEVKKDGKIVGMISSGTISPCLNKGIALAYVDPDERKIGSELDIVIRGKNIKSTIVKSPFVKKDWISTQ
ncbi:glycine cleavage system protein T [Thermoplasmatales archaeon ex4572_165]|nr:MAG: glycine cleavage system protein T [Thermoplasmatales archaeon ex4572_165]RLF58969.1 MAG: glycine cleavage system aminomethyltransferase GcvT [Thermoplasmata archaeon]